MELRDEVRQGVYLNKESWENLLLTLHGAGSRATKIIPLGNFWATVQEIERQFGEQNPKDRKDWSSRAMEVRSRPGGTW